MDDLVFYSLSRFTSSRVYWLLPSKQCVQTWHFGNPMAAIRSSSFVNLSDDKPKRSRMMSTIFLYSGESVVAYASRFLLPSPSSSAMMRRVISSMSLFDDVKLMNGQP